MASSRRSSVASTDVVFEELPIDDDEESLHMVARAVAIAHYQLKGPLRVNFVRNYINHDIMQHAEIQAARLAGHMLMLTTAVAFVWTVTPWAYAAIEMNSRCPLSKVLDYTLQPALAGSCGVVSLWNLFFVPLALIGVKLWTCILENVFHFHGKRFMLYIYRVLDLMMPSLDPLKYHHTPFLYQYVSQGCVLVFLQMLIEAIMLRQIKAVVIGYTASRFLLYLTPIVLAPPKAAIGTLQCELQQWSEDSCAQPLFLRLLTCDDAFFVLSSIELQELREAREGTLKHLFEDARDQTLSFGLQGEAEKRRVHFTPLYLKTVHFPVGSGSSGSAVQRLTTMESIG